MRGIRTVIWWRWRALELAVALAIVTCSILLTNSFQQRYRANVPADNWFAVHSIWVPDFHVGDNPTLTYDREIKEPFLGFWLIEVERAGESGRFLAVCSGSGINDYQVVDYVPKNSMTWEWFIGRRCPDGALVPGQYRLRGSWKMKRQDWPEKVVVAYSNLFKVLP